MQDRNQCHCGAVEFSLSAKPTEIFECSCSICQKLGVLWAYYHCDDVVLVKGEGTTNIYQWNNKILEFHSCSNCGCTTHWIATDKTFRDKMGVNARLIDGLSKGNTSIQHIDHGDTNNFWTLEIGKE